MKTYDKYKDCGVEWLGKIPVHWGNTSIKNVLEIPITDGPHTTPELIDEGVPFISAEAIKNGKIDFDRRRGNISEQDYELFSKKYIPRLKDIFMVKSGATTGNVAILDDDIKFTIWSPLAVFRANVNKVIPEFLHLFLQSSNLRNAVEVSWSYGTQQNIGMGVLSNLNIPIPTLPEQIQIASYLGYKTSLIDELIAKKQRKIELLKEQRTAIINQAVTKGLNSKVKFKNSDVEWIEAIPELWEVIRSKFLLSDKDGIKIGPFGSALKLDTLVESGIKIYGQANIINNNFLIGKRFLTKNKYENEFLQYTILPGDLLITMMGTTGKAKIFEQSFEKGIMDSHLIRLRLNDEVINPNFFELLINESSYVNNQIRLNSKGSIMEGLNSSIIKEIKIILPPKNEQNQILDFISKKTSEITQLIENESKKVLLLQEYRQSLISEVVTGKIDVRSNVQEN